jgi:hypothetical protein
MVTGTAEFVGDGLFGDHHGPLLAASLIEMLDRRIRNRGRITILSNIRDNCVPTLVSIRECLYGTASRRHLVIWQWSNRFNRLNPV